MSEPIRTNAGSTVVEEQDVRARILTVAATHFAQDGYNTASLEGICADCGIDAETLASHYPGRYELFRDVVLATTVDLLRATDGIESNDPRQARSVLTRLIEQSVKVTIATRATGGFYRSEYRYLTPEDGQLLSNNIGELRRRIREPLMLHRPRLSEEDANILASATQSVIASITVHATSLPAPKLQTLLSVTAMRLLDSEPAGHDADVGLPATPIAWHSDTTDVGTMYRAAVDLCFARGYRGVTMEDIAEGAGLPTSTVRSHYASTSDLLTSACLNGFESLRIDTHRAIATSATPRDALIALARSYVRHYFSDHKLMTIYLADARNFDDANRRIMLDLQDESITTWVRALTDARPELSRVESTFLVFAAMSLISDLARLLRWRDDPSVMARIEKCASMVMALIR